MNETDNVNNQNNIDKNLYIKVPVGKKLAFSGIELGSQFSWTLISSFLMVFLTDNLYIPAGMVSVMFLVCRFWDAANDPVLGMISDRTRSKWGRYRPYIMFGSLPLFVLTVLLFLPHNGWSVNAKYTYVFIIYFILVAVYTCVNLCTGSLNAVMTQDPAERGSIASFRVAAAFIGGTIVMIIISYFEPVLNAKYDGYGYFILVLAMAIVAVPLQFFGAKCQREVVPPTKKRKVPIRLLLKYSFKNSEFIKLSAMFFFMGISWYGVLTIEYYWFIYVVGDGQMYGLANVIGLLPSVLGIVVAPWISNKLRSKGKAVIWMYVLYAVLNVISYFVFNKTMNVWLIIISLGLLTLFMVSAQSMMYGMVPDTVEYSELISGGIRMDGFITTLVSFWNKMGITIGTAATGWILEAAGYEAAVAQQSQTVISAMNITRWLMPAAASVIIIVICATYKIDYDMFDNIVARLQSRNGENAETAE